MNEQRCKPPGLRAAAPCCANCTYCRAWFFGVNTALYCGGPGTVEIPTQQEITPGDQWVGLPPVYRPSCPPADAAEVQSDWLCDNYRFRNDDTQ